MSAITANGLATLAGRIDETEQGPWTARVEVDDDSGAIEGAVTIVAGNESWVGTVLSGRIEAGRYIADVIAGKGALTRALPAKFYYQATLLAVIADVMAETGETFDATGSDASLSSYAVPLWMRVAGEARIALAAVAAELGGIWRVNRAGKVVMVKADAFTAVTGEYVEEDRDPSRNAVVIAPENDEPIARPGVTVGEDRIVTVATVWDGAALRQVLQTHDGTDKAQDQATIIADLARRATALDSLYMRLYPSRVVAQDADGTLHLLPDDERVRGDGLSHVPMRHGLPGLVVKVVPGQYVNLFFENGSPKAPAAALWPDGSSVGAVVLDTPAFSIGAGAAQKMVLGDMLLQILSQLTVGTAMGPSSVPLNAASFTGFLSAKHKLDS